MPSTPEQAQELRAVLAHADAGCLVAAGGQVIAGDGKNVTTIVTANPDLFDTGDDGLVRLTAAGETKWEQVRPFGAVFSTGPR